MTYWDNFIEFLLSGSLKYTAPIVVLVGCCCTWLGKVWATKLIQRQKTDLDINKTIVIRQREQEWQCCLNIYHALQNLVSVVHHMIQLSDEEKKQQEQILLTKINDAKAQYDTTLHEAQPLIPDQLYETGSLVTIAILQWDRRQYMEMLRVATHEKYRQGYDFEMCYSAMFDLLKHRMTELSSL